MAAWVRAEIDVTAPAAAVMAALTRVEAVSAWWGADGGLVEARPGGAWRFAWGDVVARGVVDRATDRELVVRDLVTATPGGEMGPTRLAFTLRPKSHKTVVLVEETGFREGATWDAYYENARASWPIALLDLKRHVEAA